VLIRSINDIPQQMVESVLLRAQEFESGVLPVCAPRPRIIGLVFLETSLRTRIGFSAAAIRLGHQVITVDALRAGATSMPESWGDTLRTVAGYSDVVVARIGMPLVLEAIPPGIAVPVLNGGDGGPNAEHPSQALIDVHAMQCAVGPIPELSIAIYGDLRMRAVRSLLTLLARTPPRRLALVTNPRLTDGIDVPEALHPVTEYREPGSLDDVQVLYVAGMPHGALPDSERSKLRITTSTMAALSADAVVLSPLPVIDEIERGVMIDGRMRAFQQSDRGVHVRMALLEILLERAHRATAPRPGAQVPIAPAVLGRPCA